MPVAGPNLHRAISNWIHISNRTYLLQIYTLTLSRSMPLRLLRPATLIAAALNVKCPINCNILTQRLPVEFRYFGHSEVVLCLGYELTGRVLTHKLNVFANKKRFNCL